MKLLVGMLTALSLMGSVSAHANQPNMEAALAALEQAKASLQKATADKGGHRVKAMKAVDEAIGQVKAGIAYDKKH